MKLFMKGVLLTAAAAVAGATSASAQNTDNAQIAVSATVMTALNVTNVQDLTLGSAFPGTTRTVGAGDAASGEFNVAGGVGGGVDLSFSLPAALSDGVNTLPISFTAAAGADRGTANSFNPTLLHQSHLDATSGVLNVYLGASVIVPAAQAPGAYTGTVQLTATYNGL